MTTPPIVTTQTALELAYCIQRLLRYNWRVTKHEIEHLTTDLILALEREHRKKAYQRKETE